MRIIIAIDILGGKCVRLTRGNYDDCRIYSDDPVVVAKSLEENNIRYLHLVDLDGAREGRMVNRKILEDIASETSLEIDFGGGIRSDSDIRTALDAGAKQVNCGSMAVKEKELFLELLGKYGPEKIILGADAVNRMVATHGWTKDSGLDVVDFISGFSTLGVKYVVCTDISRDGMMEGPAVGLYRHILSACSVNLIASGGITSVEDLKDVSRAGCEGAIIGKAFYEGRINADELAEIC